MNNLCEDSCPWTDYFLESANNFTYGIANLFTTALGLTFNPTDVTSPSDEVLQRLSEFFQELINLLSFDDFQLQLLKVFLLTFVSTLALIFVAWHIYGSRISEQFMTPNTPGPYESTEQ